MLSYYEGNWQFEKIVTWNLNTLILILYEKNISTKLYSENNFVGGYHFNSNCALLEKIPETIAGWIRK